MLTNTRHTHAGQSHRDQPGDSLRTRNSLRRRALLALPTAVVFAALIGAPLAAGLIMRDGGICDPIRHMGC